MDITNMGLKLALKNYWVILSPGVMKGLSVRPEFLVYHPKFVVSRLRL